jgi:transcriptional regulator with XRE-family HTH domain
MAEADPRGPSDDERFAASVKRLREARGWSQGELAKRMTEAGFEGFHQTTISRIEKNERPVRVGEAHGLARTFGTMVGAMIAPTGAWELVDNAQRQFEQTVNELGRLHSSASSFEGCKSLLQQDVEALEALEPIDQLEPDLAKWIEAIRTRTAYYLSLSPEAVARQAVEPIDWGDSDETR